MNNSGRTRRNFKKKKKKSRAFCGMMENGSFVLMAKNTKYIIKKPIIKETKEKAEEAIE